MEAARRNDPAMTENDVVNALAGFDGLWESLFPAEQARIARLLIERVTVSAEGLAVDLRTEGLGSVIRELVTRSEEHTSELQSLMRISYAVFCLKKKKRQTRRNSSKQ